MNGNAFAILSPGLAFCQNFSDVAANNILVNNNQKSTTDDLCHSLTMMLRSFWKLKETTTLRDPQRLALVMAFLVPKNKNRSLEQKEKVG